jgi:two-component system response regulator AtoC
MDRKPLLLLVDDDPRIRQVVGRFAAEAGFDVLQCSGGAEALAALDQTVADLALVDLYMPGIDGLDVLRAIRDRASSCGVVLMSGQASIDSAVEAIKLGARDYLAKPLDLDRLGALLTAVREDHDHRVQMMATEATLARQLEFCGMVGRDPAILQLFSLIRRLAPHARTALITGETGTGKELVARALHRLGPRQNKRFVVVNCSAIVETLAETELFGHVKGAFTGASESKAGYFEFADGGTVFLDEVGELPAAAQAKLLRVLESGETQRVGSPETHRVDVHVVAATNRDLRGQADAGRFRADLFYRLAVVELRIPPLRERREDIPYLTSSFITDCSRRLGKRLSGITPEAERLLVSATWEGNVRQLRNLIERACMLAQGDFITERDLGGVAQPAASWQVASADLSSTAPRVSRPLADVEMEHIEAVLRQTGGNKKVAAEILGISRRALYRRLEHRHLEG